MQFRAEIFHFFEQDRLLFAKVDIGVTKFPTKTAAEKVKTMGPGFFLKVKKWACAFRFQWGIFILFGRGKPNFGGGDTTSKLASQ